MAWPDFASLKAELSARGFSYLTDARLGRYINQGRAEIDDLELWPYLEQTATGSAPLSITDLRTITSVWDSGGNVNLTARDRRDLVDTYRDLTTTGSPRFFYVENGTSLKTYPAGGTLTVRYYRFGPDLSNSTDVPLMPARYAYVIVDAAARRAYIDKDNFDSANALQAEIDRMTAIMRNALLQEQAQDAVYVLGSGSDW